MIDYGPDQPDSGEVFDVTALTNELAPMSRWRAVISLKVECNRDYSQAQHTYKTEAAWSADAGEWMPYTANLTDAINGCLPDSPEIEKMRKRIKKLRSTADQLEIKAKFAKLEQAGQLRSTNPIARVTELAGIQSLPSST